MNRILTTLLASVALVSACAAIEKADPSIPVNANTYDTCPGLTAPDGSQLRCLKPMDDPGAGGEQCPSSGHYCIELFPTAPNAMGAVVRDAGAQDAAPAALVPTTAPSPLEAPPEVFKTGPKNPKG